MENSTMINSTIQEQVYQIIRREVINRGFREGQQLKEAELAQRFNVSRSPVREALHRLAGDGILTIIPNRGIFVKEFTEKYIIDVLDLRFLLEQRGLMCAANTLCAEKRAELMRMRGLMERMIDTGDTDIARHSELDTAFHSLIMALNNNTFISEVADRISALCSMFRYVSLSSPERATESQREHIGMIDSLLDGDAARAASICGGHIAGTRKRVVEEFARRRADIG